MDIRGPEMRRRLLDFGLKTDSEGRVLFDAASVDWAIAQTPKTFDLFDRDGQIHRTIGGGSGQLCAGQQRIAGAGPSHNGNPAGDDP